jgi:putative redox protein
MRITTRCSGGLRFSGDPGAAHVVMDATPESGGKGEAPTPTEIVLHGLAGCTGMDVAAMLGPLSISRACRLKTRGLVLNSIFLSLTEYRLCP